MDTGAVDTVLVTGASGGTGQEVLRLAGGRVPTVRALTRDGSKREHLLAAGADEVVVDDLLQPRTLDQAVQDVE
jgi:NmrA-like family.